jgi:pyruvate kinase
MLADSPIVPRREIVRHSPAASDLPDPVALLAQLRSLRAEIDGEARRTFGTWQSRITRRAFAPSARNLARYLALRSRDLRKLQADLVPWGLSSLGRSEARVMPSLDAVIATLSAVIGEPRGHASTWPSAQAHTAGLRRLAANTDELFGPRVGSRRVRIMVTMSADAAADYESVRELVSLGMDCARINCGHDDPATWEGIATNVRAAASELRRSCRVLMDLSGPRLRVEGVHLLDPDRRVITGDQVFLRRAAASPSSADSASQARMRTTPAFPFELDCSVSAVFDAIRLGHRVFIDAGKIDAKVEAIGSDGAVLRVTRTGAKGGKLATEKGLNFPDSHLTLGALTTEDRRALDCAIPHADIIGYSFVQTAEDVAVLQRELAARIPSGTRAPALIAKIETQRAVEHLPAIIVQAAGRQPFGVMIARGDLGVELGYERLAEIQEEILWLSEAAHIPVIWATQVLERLIRKGTPSRAEMTDAAMGERAECVMLNKGPYIARGVAALDDILTRMQTHQRKKTARLRELHVWQHQSD